MDYLETDFTIEPATDENREIIMALLSEINYDSFKWTPTGLLGYISEENFSDETLEKTIAPLKELFQELSYTSQQIEQKNWNAAWESNFPPIFIKDECCIRAPFHNIENKFKYEIIIEPKMSFGTGHHATTALIIELMLNLELTNKKVLDMGSGTGILGIFASLRGAEQILAVDIDQWAYENAKENADRNQIKNMEVKLGNAEILANKQFDVILANINRNILLNDMEIYANSMQPGCQLIMSGFYANDLAAISDKAEALGLTYDLHLENNNWVAVKYTRKK